MIREAVRGGLRVEQLPGGWAVIHDGSSLPAVKGLRQRRFAEEARNDLLATGTDFTGTVKQVTADRARWAEVYVLWRQREDQRKPDPVTHEYYSSRVYVGVKIPSAAKAARMRGES